MTTTDCDLLIIGGGVNGCGIARDAAGRGLKVVVAEQGDLAGATSSASSKLIHGGLRYLEFYEFRLVREALAERDVLLAMAPHIIWPLEFVLPHAGDVRPAWMIRAGLFLYDHLGWRPGKRSRLPRSKGVRFAGSPYGHGLRGDVARGFVYADCWVDDARLTVLNALDARARGATILTRAKVTDLDRGLDAWTARLATGATVRSRAVVNAAGPWAGTVLGLTGSNSGPRKLRLIKGSHIIVPRVHEGDHAFILQNDDRRIVFVIPYEGRYTLIGTTDVPFDGDPADVRISADETAYLCRAASRWLAKPVAPEDVVWSYAGVRPLYDDGADSASAVTRDYVLELDTAAAPVLSIFGGKITTFRRLAEHAMDKLATVIPNLKPAWTAGVTLPGGDIPGGDFERFARDFAAARPWMPPAHARSILRRHGTRAAIMMADAGAIGDLGPHFGAGLYGREIDWLVTEEWARAPVDILWRRTKLGLHMSPAERDGVARYLKDRHGLPD